MSVGEGEERRAVASIVARIADIDAETWDACANPDAATFNPFIAHAFLDALEQSDSVGDRHTGWIPQHITVDDGGGGIAACAPCYVKLNSTGRIRVRSRLGVGLRARGRSLLSETTDRRAIHAGAGAAAVGAAR